MNIHEFLKERQDNHLINYGEVGFIILYCNNKLHIQKSFKLNDGRIYFKDSQTALELISDIDKYFTTNQIKDYFV